MRAFFILMCFVASVFAEEKSPREVLSLEKPWDGVWNVEVVKDAEWEQSNRKKGAEEKVAPLSTPLLLKSFKGDVQVMSLSSGLRKLEKGYVLKNLDRFILGAKSELSLSWRGLVVCEAGSGSIVQLVHERDSQPILRLFKGKMRVSNQSDDAMKVETLNSIVSVPHGKTDLIISAMNTLVAPREGKDVKVKTKMVYKSVPPGRYGLIMADGSLLYAGGKSK